MPPPPLPTALEIYGIFRTSTGNTDNLASNHMLNQTYYFYMARYRGYYSYSRGGQDKNVSSMDVSYIIQVSYSSICPRANSNFLGDIDVKR